MSDRLDKLDYYTLLGTHRDASQSEIRSSFRQFARRYHPDQFAGAEEKIQRAEQIYRRGSEAYQILMEEPLRAAYDVGLLKGQLRLSSEEVDHVRADAKAEPRKKKIPIQSPQALAYFRKAVEAANDSRWREAWRAMSEALQVEPGNAFIKKRLQKIEATLRNSAR